jgi:hypothetical protein
MDNYTGPYWSDGKLQQSVEFGSSLPTSDLDRASRLHDSAYAKFKDERHRIAADSIYSDTLRTVDSASARLIRGLPVYGNYTKNRAYEYGEALASGMKFGGLPGAVGSLAVASIKNLFLQHDLLINMDKYKREVRDYYATDPLKATHQSYGTETVAADRGFLPVMHPKTIETQMHDNPAPQQNKTRETQDNDQMKFFKNKVVPDQPAHAAPKAVTQTPVKPYKPLKKKVHRATAADVMLYLKYHPGQLDKVEKWLNEQRPDLLPPTAQNNKNKTR